MTLETVEMIAASYAATGERRLRDASSGRGGGREREEALSAPKRVAAIDVSHWHSTYDAAYLRILRDLGCDIVGVSDRAERIARERSARFGSTPFTDYRRMIETTGRNSSSPSAGTAICRTPFAFCSTPASPL